MARFSPWLLHYTLPDAASATGHSTAVEEEEKGIITRKKAEKGVAIVTRNNQHFREARVMGISGQVFGENIGTTEY